MQLADDTDADVKYVARSSWIV